MQYSSYRGISGPDTGYAPSALLFDTLDAHERNGLASGFFEDMTKFRTGVPSSTEVAWTGVWKAVGIATNGIFGQSLTQGEGLTLSTESADNDYLHAQAGLPFILGATAGDFAFEARLKFAGIANTLNDFFIGLGDTMTLGAAVPITVTAGDLATEKFVGFHRDATDGDELNTVHNDAAATHTILKNGVTTLVANTFLKVGMTLKNGVFRFYVNAVEAADSVAVTATNFPDDAAMGPLFGQTAVAASGGLTTISWIKALQFRGHS